MELRQLEYFRAVAGELHFTRAAEKLRISQPSLSQQIRALEYEIGMPLFDRIGKKIALTEAGRILLSHSHNVFYELEQAKASIGELQGLGRGRLAIGTLLTLATFLLPSTLVSFHQQYPKIELSIQEMSYEQIRFGLLENRLDFGILFSDVSAPELESIPLLAIEFALAVPIDHQLASNHTVDFDMIKELPMILLPETYALRQAINQASHVNGVTIQPILEMTSLDPILSLVAKGMGVTILPQPYLVHLQSKQVSILPISKPFIRKEVSVFYRRDKFMCKATQVFIDQLIASSKSFNA